MSMFELGSIKRQKPCGVFDHRGVWPRNRRDRAPTSHDLQGVQGDLGGGVVGRTLDGGVQHSVHDRHLGVVVHQT